MHWCRPYTKALLLAVAITPLACGDLLKSLEDLKGDQNADAGQQTDGGQDADAGTSDGGFNGTIVTKEIGTEGGSIQSDDASVKLDIPAEALPNGVTISISQATAEGPAWLAGSSPIFSFGPDGTQFSKPVEVCFTIAPPSDLSLELAIYWTNSENTFERLPTSVSTTGDGNLQLCGQTTHFSKGVAGGVPACPEKTMRCKTDDRCVAQPSDCEKPACTEGQSLCPDGKSCVKDFAQCPSAPPECPREKPVRCADGLCVADPKECVQTTTCGDPSLFACPDGSCVKDPKECKVSCPPEAPVMCADGKCVADRKDCGPPPTCPPEAPVQCADGKCVADKLDCAPPPACPPEAPVQCPDGKCVADRLDCAPPPVTCEDPTPVQCPDGSCVADKLDCAPPPVTCEDPTPVQCPDGKCVADKLDCAPPPP